MTENSIANWLTTGEPVDTTGDTAIMKSGDARLPKVDSLADSTVRPLTPSADAVPTAPAKQFDSVAEEAEDIIRRHREEKQRTKEAQKKS